MGIFTDFYVADPSEIDAAFGWLSSKERGTPPEFDPDDPEGSAERLNEWMEQQPSPEPTDAHEAQMAALNSLNYKGVLSGCVSTLRHLLLGTKIEAGGDWIVSSFSHTLERIPDDLVEAVASRSDQEVLALAPAWAAHEEVRWSEKDAREFLPLFASIARTARDHRKGVYLLISGF
jgi:hypothetical protein